MFYISMFPPGFVGFLFKGKQSSTCKVLVNKPESQKQKSNSLTHVRIASIAHQGSGKTALFHD